MSGHLGRDVSALLDGRLSAEETEAAWDHVHGCHLCRDEVEREGWVKTRLSTLSFGNDGAPDHLKGALLGMPPGDYYLGAPRHGGGQSDMGNRSRGRRAAGIAALGGGAVGAAVVGVLALGTAPADVPNIERRQQQPTSHTSPAPAPSRSPLLRATR